MKDSGKKPRNKLISTIIILVALLLVSGGTNIYAGLWASDKAGVQALSNEEIASLNDVNSELKVKVEELSSTRNRLVNEKKKYLDKVRFLDSSVAIVPDDGTGLYHKYDCYIWEQSYVGYWVYNPEAAEGRGYVACPACH